MTAVFTNRLIGSAILVVAAVVFLPDLLDGQKQVNKDDFKAIPERPEFAEVAQPAVFSQDQHQAARNTALQPLTDQSPALDAVADSGTDPVPDAEVPASTHAAGSSEAPGGGTATDPVPSQTSVSPHSSVAGSAGTGGNVQAATLPVDPLPAEQTTVTSPAAQDVAVTKPVETKPEKPLSQAAYVVKVGSFGKEQNANALVSKLKAAGHNAFTRKIVNGQGTTMVSVLVGPDLKKDKLEAKLAELQQLAQVPKLKVSSYIPVDNN